MHLRLENVHSTKIGVHGHNDGGLVLYLWEILNEYPEGRIGRYDRENSIDRFEFKRGKPVAIDINAAFDFDAAATDLLRYDDLANNAMVPLVSPLVAELLKTQCREHVQLLPTVVRCTDREITDYSVVNVVHRIKAIDHAASDYIKIPGTDHIMKFRRLVLRPEAMGSAHIARDEEYSGNLMVSASLKDMLLQSGAKALGLYLPG